MIGLKNIILGLKREMNSTAFFFHSGNTIKVAIKTQKPLTGQIVLSAMRNDPFRTMEKPHLEVGHTSEIYSYSC